MNRGETRAASSGGVHGLDSYTALRASVVGTEKFSKGMEPVVKGLAGRFPQRQPRFMKRFNRRNDGIGKGGKISNIH